MDLTISSCHSPGKINLFPPGLTPYTGAELVKALGHHFKEGSYDLLRKNCNSFSDCALWFLLERRLDVSYRGLEQVGAVADSNAGLVQYLSGSRYMPNPAADSFDLERTVCMVDTEKRLTLWCGVACGGKRMKDYARTTNALRSQDFLSRVFTHVGKCPCSVHNPHQEPLISIGVRVRAG